MADKSNRLQISYENKSSDFIISSEDLQQDCFKKQFYFFYHSRINLLIPRILNNAKLKIDSQIQITQLSNVSKTTDLFVVGVILKKMKYRPSVLYAFQDEEALDFDFREKLNSNHLVSDEDVLEFESDQQVVKLMGNIDKDLFVTGDVVGLYGRVTKSDYFNVKEVIFPTIATQIKWPLVEKNCYVAFLSGLLINNDMTENSKTFYALEKLANWLCAEINLEEKELEIIQNISRLVIAGESISISNKDISDRRFEFISGEEEIDRDAIDQFDKILSRFVGSIHVDLMSGSNDPTSLFLPQQPIPRLLFPLSRRYGKLLNTVTNPYKFSLNGLTFLGTSGQNVLDLSRLTVGQSPLEIMNEILNRGHIFPSVPDSIDGFPFQMRDPFILTEMPHIFFAGNQEHIGQMWMNSLDSKTLLLTIPVFKKNFSLTLLNLRNMQITEYDFSQENYF